MAQNQMGSIIWSTMLKSYFLRASFLVLLFSCYNLFAQSDSSFYSITTTAQNQIICGINVTLSSPTNAQSNRLDNQSYKGYYISDKNTTEEINFKLSQPVKRIRIIGAALSARRPHAEIFTLHVNGQQHLIQPSELVTPNPTGGRECILLPDGSILGDTISPGDGTFILVYENKDSILDFKIKNTVLKNLPEGAIYNVQIFTECDSNEVPDIDKPDPDGLIDFTIPNIFTPNADGLNDFFIPKTSSTLKQFELHIYNRWGGKIFSTTDYMKGWDGTIAGRPQNEGVFFWTCYYQGNGSGLQMKKGTVTLVR